MKKLFILTVILLLFYGCAGDGESDEIDADDFLACNADDLISGGKSCAYNSGRSLFSVSEDGNQGCIDNLNSSESICDAFFVSLNDGFFAFNGGIGRWKIVDVDDIPVCVGASSA